MKQQFNKIFILLVFVIAFTLGANRASAVSLQMIDELAPIDIDGGGGGGGGSSSTTTTPTTPTNTSPLYINLNGVQSSYKMGDKISFTLSAYYNTCSNTTVYISGNASVVNGGYYNIVGGEVAGSTPVYESGEVSLPTRTGNFDFVLNISATRIRYEVVDANGNVFNSYSNMDDAYTAIFGLIGDRNDEGLILLPRGRINATDSFGGYSVRRVGSSMGEKQVSIPFTVTASEPTVEVQVNNSRNPNPITKSAALNDGVRVTWDSNTENCKCTTSEPYVYDNNGNTTTSCGEGGGTRNFQGTTPSGSSVFKVSKTTTFSVKCSN